ncbi:leucine-rich repeat and guanylate kinase domain-containing protein isoform X2 [Thalassophryne amazonica]|uniref:leucine-rich repeat and guanylate kinase domain-containing protein isoform X2 n=1 Tax=Thalassophryne amazonica TaxID=390379 RepID=UPI0014726252|nr:leucine-rich repeat and guanylate kinase domain-containing protein isoform X2 [Thalassophryne amazonica]
MVSSCISHHLRAGTRPQRFSHHLSLPRGNQLETTEGLESLNHLLDLDLSLNRITSISGLQNQQLLGSINLENNMISEIQEFKKVDNLFLLRDLNLLGNLVQEQPDYRLSVIFLLQHLTVLDKDQVTAEEKVSSVNKYQPPLEVVAARDHMTNLMYQMMQPQVLYESTLPDADFPYAMLVLAGPQGCGKRELTYKLCEEFSEHFSSGVCHTTRGPYFGEEDGHDYHYVTEEDFQNMILMGKFVQTMQYGGHSYGLSRDTIEDAAREGLACCVHMELEGVLSLKHSYFEPRYILLLPTEVGRYRERLKDRGLYTPAQIDAAVARIELYANTNRQQPGFFDNVIPCDDFEEAYQKLRQVVREYLLPEEEGEQDLDKRQSSEETSTASGRLPLEEPPSALSRSGSASRQAPPLNLSHLYYRNYSCKILAELRPQQTTVERASLRRRERLVREALVGRTPAVCSRLFRSLDESCSAMSVPSSAFAGPPDASGQECTSETLKVSSRQSCDRPGSSTDQVTVAITPCSDRRPGSTNKPLLPPIPTGRKTPAVLSPAASPSPNPAAHEG